MRTARGAIQRLLGRLAAIMLSDGSDDWTLFILREQMRPTAAFDRLYGGAMGELARTLVGLVCIATGRSDRRSAQIVTVTLIGQVAALAAQQLDQARSTAADAAAARRQVADADAQVLVARKQVVAARAGVEARRAQVDQARATLGNLRLRAPVSGQVVNRSVNLGSYVGPGTQLMAIIPDYLWITANFKKTQLTLMRPGQPVAIRVDADPDVAFVGHVDSVQRGAGQAFALLPPQNATGNYVKVVQRVPVRITFDLKHGPDPRHYPIGSGMSVIPTVKVR